MIHLKKCFIISPIGKEDSEEREHANQVFEYIIRPALEECNIEPIRADQMYRAGKITEQIYEAIQTFDMCIVVLAFNNPNVYYELAVAQCAVRPVIILVEKGKILPFDLKDERSVFYDLTIPSYTERTFINQIIKIIKNFKEVDWKVSSSIPGFSPRKDEGYQYFKEVFDFGGKMEWQNIINDSNEKLYLMGTALRTWRHLEEFEKQLIKKAEKGCEIRLMILDPENEFLNQIHDERSPQLPRHETVRNTILECRDFYSQCATQAENIEFRQILQGRMTQNQVINENYCVYMPHFYSTLITYSPCWKFKNQSQLYQHLLKEFNTLWYLNAPIKKEVFKEKEEEEEELLKELRNKLTIVDDLINLNKYPEATEKLTHIIERADLLNFEEIKSLAFKKLKDLRDPYLVIFLSYATKDAELFNIEELATRLKSFKEIKEVLFWKENTDENIIKFMSDSINRCDVFVLFCSESALKSNAVEREWTAADADMMGKPIIPIFLKTEHIPPLLRSRLGIEFDLKDFNKNIEHIHSLILKKLK